MCARTREWFNLNKWCASKWASIRLVWHIESRSKIKGKISSECIAFSSFFTSAWDFFFQFLLLFRPGRTLNYLGQYTKKKTDTHNALSRRKKRDRITVEKKKKTIQKEQQNWIVKRCWRNPSCSNDRRPMKIAPKPIDLYACIVWCCLRLLQHRYYIIINIICWLTKHKYCSFFSLYSFFFCIPDSLSLPLALPF